MPDFRRSDCFTIVNRQSRRWIVFDRQLRLLCRAGIAVVLLLESFRFHVRRRQCLCSIGSSPHGTPQGVLPSGGAPSMFLPAFTRNPTTRRHAALSPSHTTGTAETTPARRSPTRRTRSAARSPIQGAA